MPKTDAVAIVSLLWIMDVKTGLLNSTSRSPFPGPLVIAPGAPRAVCLGTLCKLATCIFRRKFLCVARYRR